MNHEKVILASASPRRKELLFQIGIRPEIIPSHVEEKVTAKEPARVVEELSLQKARDVADGCGSGCLVIGADTVVAVDGNILGKPGDHEEAYRMIRSLAGRRHQVYTGVTVIGKQKDGEKTVTFSEETTVEVLPMSEEEMREYAMSEEPMDKAGAYAVQGFFARYIGKLEGSYANVMGLPVSRLYQELKKF